MFTRRFSLPAALQTGLLTMLLVAIAVIGLVNRQAFAADKHSGAKVSLPLVIYADGQGQSGYIPSGWMGNPSAIKYDGSCTTHPRKGNSDCLKIQYTSGSGWGGIAWQNPANNWGDQSGGFNLTGAKKLTFWVRGKKAGQVVSFGFGLIGSNKTYHDTAKGKVKVTLTKHWKKYSISLKGKDMKRIVVGFFWTAAPTDGKAFTFYLDKIEYKN
ncbi:MAG: hypothetical protein ACP5I8_05215 [Phycisphaerae bacterium]